MELRQVSAWEFAQTFPKPNHIYNSVAFTELNRRKCDEAAYLIFADTKVRGGLIAGLRDGIWHSPFSAPYGGLVTTARRPVDEIEEMYTLAAAFSRQQALGLRVTLAPEFMDPDTFAKSVNVLSRMSSHTVCDINHHAEIKSVTDPAQLFSYNARGALKQALRLPYTFEQLTPTRENISRVHRVITLNHSHRGYPVHMTVDDIAATAPIVGADFFVLTLDGEDIAAAQIHHPWPGVAQIIYWGDVPGHQAQRPMHRLAAAIFGHYIGRGDIDIVDIGISTVDGIPNPGLCFFKESIGCRPTPRPGYLLAR